MSFRWIADASVIRYEHFSGGQCNEPLAIRKEDGTQLNFDSIIKDVLEDGADVWVLFKEDLEALGLIAKGKKRASEQQKNSNTQFSP